MSIASSNGPDSLSERTLIRFWGVRGSVPTPGPSTVYYGGNTSCVEVRAAGQILILDAGTGLRPLGEALLREFGDQPVDLTLLLTHTHWDHIQGLPFFKPVYKPQNRLRILGYEGARMGLASLLSSQMESPFFPVHLREVPANVQIEEFTQRSVTIGSIGVETAVANHPGTCVGYRLKTADGSIAFFPDNEPYRGKLRSSGNKPGSTSQSRDELVAQETRQIDFLKGVDVLIMDAQFDADEYEDHVGWGHGCLEDVVELALACGARKLFLFHHAPEHDDARIRDMVARGRQHVVSRGGALVVDAAREGLTVNLGG